MSETIRATINVASNTDYSAEQRRANCVAAALEVIAAQAPAMTSTGQLEYEMSKLSEYADHIQAALKVK